MSERRPKVVGVVLFHKCGEDCRPAQRPAAAADGPAKVNSPEYVSQWQRIFGGKATQASA